MQWKQNTSCKGCRGERDHWHPGDSWEIVLCDPIRTEFRKTELVGNVAGF